MFKSVIENRSQARNTLPQDIITYMTTTPKRFKKSGKERIECLITIPANICAKSGISIGMPLDVLYDEENMIVRIIKTQPKHNHLKISPYGKQIESRPPYRYLLKFACPDNINFHKTKRIFINEHKIIAGGIEFHLKNNLV